MTDDVRAAAERIVRSVHETVYTGPLALQGKLADALVLADAVLTEHPADDGEPVDEAWLRAAGFTVKDVENDAVLHAGLLSVCVYEPDDPVFWRVDYERLPEELWPKTRGHVRRLCAALGVTLTERSDP